MKATPNLFSYVEKAEWALKCLVSTDPGNPHLASEGVTLLGPISATAKNSLIGAAFFKGKLARGTNHSPSASLLRKATLA